MGDAKGNTAAVSFKKGQVVVNRGNQMPIPALFNTAYDRERELLRYYEDWGGDYAIDIYDPKIPRFVRAARMMDDYGHSKKIVKNGLRMLQDLRVNDAPEWSVLFDVPNRTVYFRTRQNPEIKWLSFHDLAFSAASPNLILNIDDVGGGDVIDELEVYSNEKMSALTRDYLVPLLPEQFFTSGGITLEEYIHRTSSHSDAAAVAENQPFKGRWIFTRKNGEQITYVFDTQDDAVFGRVIMPGGEEVFNADHLRLHGNDLTFTYLKTDRTFIEVQARLEADTLQVALAGIEDSYGKVRFLRLD